MILIDFSTLKESLKKQEKNEWWFKVEKNTAYEDICDYIYLPKRLEHNTILVYNFQDWDISDIASAMEELEFPCFKYQNTR